MKKNYLIYALWMAVFLSSNVVSAQNYFGDFPVKADPKTVGNKLSKRLMETKHQLYGDRGIHYAEVCTWYGALRFAELTNNKELIKLLRNRFELLFHLEKELLPPPIHVDQNMFGCLPLRFYNITKDKRYLVMFKFPILAWSIRTKCISYIIFRIKFDNSWILYAA